MKLLFVLVVVALAAVAFAQVQPNSNADAALNGPEAIQQQDNTRVKRQWGYGRPYGGWGGYGGGYHGGYGYGGGPRVIKKVVIIRNGGGPFYG